MSASQNKKQSYDENIFLIQLPAILFLSLCAVIGFVICMLPINPKSYSPNDAPLLAHAPVGAKTESKAAGSSAEKKADGAAESEPEGVLLMKGSDCFACHKEKDNLVGPSYANIAFRYKKDADAIELLSKKIIDGGSGSWGAMPMPPHATLSASDTKKMVKYILTVKGGVDVPKIAAATEAAPSADSAPASKGLTLMKGSDCFACHKEVDALVGPSFLKIAEKYKGDATALDELSAKVIKGGSGAWGQIPMLPHANLSDDDAKEMVRYILSVQSGAAAVTAPAVSNEDPGAALFKKSDCVACHDVDKKVVGPSYKDIAARYKDDKTALKTLVQKVKTGGKGNWGDAPMISHKKMKDEDLELIIKWVLSH